MSAKRTTPEEKLGALILLLASERDGEVVAAAHAILRVLQSMGSDIHALANRLVSGGQKANGANLFTREQAKEIYFRGFEDGRRQTEKMQSAPIFQGVDGPSWHEIACACAAHPERFYGDHEKEFVENMVRRLVRGGEPTEKEANWLRKIYARRR